MKINGNKVRWLAAIFMDLLKIVYDYYPRNRQEEYDEYYDDYR